MSFRLDVYAPGDAVRIESTAPFPDRAAWRSYQPPGEGWTVWRGDVPIAAMGIWRDGALHRIWARVADGLGPGSWAQLFRYVEAILGHYSIALLECHAPDMAQARAIQRFGFVIVSQAPDQPIRLRRTPS
jgi:hypothetical protein